MSRVCWMLALAVFLAPVIVYADGADDDYWDDDYDDDNDDEITIDCPEPDWTFLCGYVAFCGTPCLEINECRTTCKSVGFDDTLVACLNEGSYPTCLEFNECFCANLPNNNGGGLGGDASDSSGDVDDYDGGCGGCDLSNGESGSALTVAMLMIGGLAFVVGGRGTRRKD